MSYFRLSDDFGQHPKVQAAGRDARDLFVAGGMYCSRHLTDGFIPTSALALLAAEAGVTRTKAATTALLTVPAGYEAGLWARDDDLDGYWLHGYLDHNWTREKVLAERDRWRRNKARHRAKPNEEHHRESTGVSTVDTTAESPPPSTSSSSNPDVSPPAAAGCTTAADPAAAAHDVIDAAFRIIGQAELEVVQAKGSPFAIDNGDRYVAAIIRRLTTDDTPRARSEVLANPDITPDELARLLAPTSFRPPPEPATQPDPDCVECHGSTWSYDDPDDTPHRCSLCCPQELIAS